MKTLVRMALLCGLLGWVPVGLGQKTEKSAAMKDKPVLQDVVLNGKIVAREVNRKNKKTGKTITYTLYSLTDARFGKVYVRRPKKAGNETPNPADFVDRQVKLTGKGVISFRKRKSGNVESLRLKEVTAIVPVEAVPLAKTTTP
jgi:hypothetical protein